MTSLISSLDKKPFQAYSVKHGIETIKILVPLAEARSFEKEFNALADPSKSEIMDLLHSRGGEVRSTGKGA